MNRILKLVTLGFFVAVVSIGAQGQTAGISTGVGQRSPSVATRPYVILTGQSLDALQQSLHSSNKVEELYGGEGIQLRVAVQHEQNSTPSAAELHDESDDVYYVVDGTATLTLGGKLENPREVDPGEWRGAHIVDGKNIDIKKGDLIIVPRGTPHERSTAGKDFTMILIKIYANGLPAKAKPAPKKS